MVWVVVAVAMVVGVEFCGVSELSFVSSLPLKEEILIKTEENQTKQITK